MKKSLLLILGSSFLLLWLASAQVELVGVLSQEEILSHFPDWQEEMASYMPDPAAIEKLKSLATEVRIEVVLGTWCPDSKRNVSAFFKIMEMVDNSQIMTFYIGIPRDKEARQPYIQGKNIVRVPTFIVTINGQEKGRIIENPANSVETDLLEIIEKKAP